jgi:MFS family permease
MDDDLQSVPPREDWYEWSLAAFYIAYIAFEWMALLWRVIPAHIYVAALVLSWGVAASLQAVAVNYPMLIFLRTLLGIGEAGFTGVPFYLSFFFKRHELAFRTAIFVSGASKQTVTLPVIKSLTHRTQPPLSQRRLPPRSPG